MPVQWFFSMAESRYSPMGISFENVHGTLWKGDVVVRKKGFGFVNLSWDVQMVGLLLLRVPVDVELNNVDMSVEGLVSFSPFGLKVTGLQGYMDEKALAPLYVPYKAKLTGRLKLDAVSAQMSWGKKLGEASGNLTWSGGPVEIPAGNNRQTYTVPFMAGKISSDDHTWFVAVNGTEQQLYLDAQLAQTGVATLSLKSALARDLGLSVPSGGRSLFDVSQKVF